MSAPSRASSIAMPCPMPRDAPVTRAVFPARASLFPDAASAIELTFTAWWNGRHVDRDDKTVERRRVRGRSLLHLLDDVLRRVETGRVRQPQLIDAIERRLHIGRRMA